MAAAFGMIQDCCRFAIPFRQRVRDPANVVKVAVNVQWAFRSKNIAYDLGFIGARCRGAQHDCKEEADKLSWSGKIAIAHRMWVICRCYGGPEFMGPRVP